jgi:hypothetical protein
MNNHQDARATPRPTPQEITLMAAHAQRAAELRIQLDLIVVRSLAREMASTRGGFQ